MLMYHPAFDANHCVYRIVAILLYSPKKILPWDLLRLLDFYYLFPGKIKDINPWPTDIKQFKNKSRAIQNQFEELTNPARVLFDLQEFQKTAILELITKGIIDREQFELGRIALNLEYVPIEFIDHLKLDNFIASDAFEIISKALPTTEFIGPNGLKKRSRMMEYVYDPK